MFEVVGPNRNGLALYEIPRGGLEPKTVSPYRQIFTEIETNEGITGLSLGGSAEVKTLGQELVGEDPICVERIWERLTTRPYNHIRNIRSLSVLDVALWDLIGKSKGESVCRLLGGPCQKRIRAYAAMLGFLPEPNSAAARSVEWMEKGFTGIKWYLPYNETAGKEGLVKNVEIIKAVRKAIGDEIDIMVDCILSNSSKNSLLYAIDLAKQLEPYRITWLEEPLNSDNLEGYERLARATSVPLAFGEHLTSRKQFKQVFDKQILSVIQPETMAVGGITEMRKLAILASVFGIPMIPHANESCLNALHLLFSQPSRACPLAEWGVKINYNVQFFYRDFYEPVDGYFQLPNGPGFGYELDMDKVRSRTDL